MHSRRRLPSIPGGSLFNLIPILPIQINLRFDRSNCSLFTIGVTPKKACFNCSSLANSTEVSATICKWAYRIDKVTLHNLLAFGALYQHRASARPSKYCQTKRNASSWLRQSLCHGVNLPVARLVQIHSFHLRHSNHSKSLTFALGVSADADAFFKQMKLKDYVKYAPAECKDFINYFGRFASSERIIVLRLHRLWFAHAHDGVFACVCEIV